MSDCWGKIIKGLIESSSKGEMGEGRREDESPERLIEFLSKSNVGDGFRKLMKVTFLVEMFGEGNRPS